MKKLVSLVLLGSFAFVGYAAPAHHERECKGRGQHYDRSTGACVCNPDWTMTNGQCEKNQSKHVR